MVTVQTMHDYLKHAMEIEKYIYMWQKSLNTVNASIQRVDRNKSHYREQLLLKNAKYSTIETDAKKERKTGKGVSIFLFFAALGIILFLLLSYGSPFLIGAFGEMSDNNISFAEGLKLYAAKSLGPSGVIAVCVIAGGLIFAVLLFGIIAIVASLMNNTKGHWKKEIAKRKAQSEKEQKTISNAINILDRKIINLNSEKRTIYNNLSQAKGELQALYSLNILPEKYRNIVAVSTMYEYLDTGRCTTIQGAGGIITTYEYDRKLGAIIDNLTEINNKLDVIIDNQYMLHSELQEANRHLYNIESDIKKIESHTASIEKSTAISAAANRQSAAIAQSIEWRAWANGIL